MSYVYRRDFEFGTVRSYTRRVESLECKNKWGGLGCVGVGVGVGVVPQTVLNGHVS